MNFALRSITGFTVGFQSKSLLEKVEDFKYQIEAMIPGVYILKTSEKCDFQVTFIESERRTIVRKRSGLDIYDVWNNKVSLDLWHLMYSIFKEDLIRNKLYSVHAVCVGNNKSALLAGHTGTGKTTVMMKLVHDLDQKIYSGNRTIIDLSDGVTAIGGTRTVSIRVADLEKYPKFKNESIAYSDRATLNLDPKHFQEDSTTPISVIGIIKVEPGADRVVKMVHPSDMHALFPFFMDTVYSDTVLCGGNEIYSGKTDDANKIWLARKLMELPSSVEVVGIAGSADFIAKEIKKYL